MLDAEAPTLLEVMNDLELVGRRMVRSCVRMIDMVCVRVGFVLRTSVEGMYRWTIEIKDGQQLK